MPYLIGSGEELGCQCIHSVCLTPSYIQTTILEGELRNHTVGAWHLLKLPSLLKVTP